MKFIDLDAQRARLQPALNEAIQKVVESGAYIFGPPVAELEAALSSFAKVKHSIACANGTDALHLVLRAFGIGPGDLVAVPSFTFAATGEAPVLVGAEPLFVDVRPDTFNMDPDSLRRAVEADRAKDKRIKAVIAVDLFGHPADYDSIQAICGEFGLWLLADIAQSFGATWKEKSVASMGHAAATSFYPAKPLGCYGDGGAVFTDDDDLADRIKSIRNHGSGSHRYEQIRVGFNSRLDSIQAAVLLEKLKIFLEEICERQGVADRYNAALRDVAAVPDLIGDVTSVWAQYTLRIESRDRVQATLKDSGIPSVIYYPVPLHRQPAFAHCPVAPGGCPASEALSGKVLSLPMHPYLSREDQDRVIAAFRQAVAAPGSHAAE